VDFSNLQFNALYRFIKCSQIPCSASAARARAFYVAAARFRFCNVGRNNCGMRSNNDCSNVAWLSWEQARLRVLLSPSSRQLA
jgi:hypothetical protein